MVWSFWREKVCVWDFSGLKIIFQVFDLFMILSRFEEREETAASLCEGRGMSWQRVGSLANR